MNDMKQTPLLLIIDLWHNNDKISGANKSILYNELSNYFRLSFLKVEKDFVKFVLSYVCSFHPLLSKWKERKKEWEENINKTPFAFDRTTALINKSLSKYTEKYDAVLQIGSLFGPVNIPETIPYLSYQDSTVFNAEKGWEKWVPHNFSKFSEKWYKRERNLFQSLTKIITYSQFARETIINHYSVEPDSVVVVGSAMKIVEERNIKWETRKKNITFVSTDYLRKGGENLELIIQKVTASIPDAVFTIVGKVPDDSPLHSISAAKCVGIVPTRKELIEIYLKTSILVHPALYDPFPSVILEAANFEIPSVASKICGIPEIIENGKSGFLCKPHDVDAFSDCLINLLNNPDLICSMGKYAKNSVVSRYNPKVVAGNIANVIMSSIDCVKK